MDKIEETSNDKLIKSLQELLGDFNGFSIERAKSNLKEFSSNDLSELSGIFSLYDPLIKKSFIIKTNLLILHNNGNLTLPENILEDMDNWIKCYMYVTKTLKKVFDKDSVH